MSQVRFPLARVFHVLGVVASMVVFLLAQIGRIHGEEKPGATVTARDGGGFGRLEFRLPDTSGLSARLAGSVLVVDFERVVALDPEKLPASMPGYLAAARLDPEKRSMRFALTQPVRIDVKEAAERVFIDLLPAGWTGPPPPLPADVVRDLARRARDAQNAISAAEARATPKVRHAVAVRLAHRAEGHRLVFESPEAGEAQLSQNGADIRMQFPATAALDEAGIRARLAEIATAIRVEESADGPVLHMSLREEKPAKGRSEEGGFLLDLPVARAADPVVPSKPPVQAGLAEPKAALAAPVPQAVEPSPSRTRAAEAVESDKTAAPAPLPQGEARADVKAPAPAEGVATSLALSAQGEGLRITVSPRIPAAVFQRGGMLWLVLQGVRSLRLPPTGSAERGLVTALVSEDVPRAVLVRITPKAAGQVNVTGSSSEWTIDIGPDIAATAEPIRLRRSDGADGRRLLRGALPGAGDAVMIEDSETGERLAVGPMSGAPHALLVPQVFADAAFVPSSLGVALVARADDLRLLTELDGFAVLREGGLTLSADARSSTGARAGHDLIVDAGTWAEDRRGSVRETGRNLLNAAADAPKRERTAARIRYAQFLLANDLAIEAGGVLALAGMDDPVAGQGKGVTLLRAIAAAGAGDLDAAWKLLSLPVLALEPEGILWRAFVDARNRRSGSALTGFRRALDVLDRYPETLQALLRPVLVQTALEAGDAYLASQQTGELERLDAAARDPGLIALLQGKIADANGRSGEASAAYLLASKSKLRPIEAEARLDLALLQLKTAPGDRERLVAELETVAMIWRRGEVEVRARAKLSEIYAGESRWRDAFAMTKRAVEIQPEHPLTRALQDETARRFEALFLEGHDNTLSRIEALAIFDEFRSLLPPGTRGDEIVRRLADRLFELDLLDQAAELLSHQVEHRLKGVARSQVATRLAVVHLVNGKPREALKVLQATRLNALPADLRRARVMLEARTLAELSRTELAIEVLAAETGADAERLRADIYWRGKRWSEAGQAYERALGLRHAGDQPLEAGERGDAVRAAVAYALVGDRLGLDRFRTKFLAKMSDSPDAETFRLITLDSISRPDAFREMARSVVSAQTMGDFLDAYRKRYPQAAGVRREAKG